MPKPLLQQPPSSSVARLLDPEAVARAIAPRHLSPARQPGHGPGPVPMVQAVEPQPEACDAGARDGAHADAGLVRLVDYYGFLYGSNPRLSLWSRRFGRGRDGAAANPLGPFAEFNSSRSALEKTILLAFTRSRRMGLLVVDPVGDFADAVQGDCGGADFPHHLAQLMGRERASVELLEAQHLVLDRWEFLQQMLVASGLFQRLRIMTSRKAALAAEQLCAALRRAGLSLPHLYEAASFARAWDMLGSPEVSQGIYTPGGRAAARFESAVRGADREDAYLRTWRPATDTFREEPGGPRRRFADVLGRFVWPDQQTRPALVVDLSPRAMGPMPWSDALRAAVIARLLSGIEDLARRMAAQGRDLNVLTVVEQGQRGGTKALMREALTRMADG
jgi:hypothetical protein